MDPDFDQVEAIAWWDPALLPDNPAIRPELLTDLDMVLAALGVETVEKAGAGKGDAPSEGASDEWPGWDVDEDAARHWAHVLAATLGTALTAGAAEQLAAAFLAEHQDTAAGLTQAELADVADEWLSSQPLNLTDPIATALPGLWTDGYLVGITSATAAASGNRADRGGWQPGDTDAAQQLVGDAGASDDLAQLTTQAPDTAQGIAQTRQSSMARELANGLLAGTATTTVAQALVDAIGDVGSAMTVTVTEITRASGNAALFIYRQSGATHVRWVSEEDGRVCAECLANEAAGPRPIGEPFPSGDTSPPIHPRCRCAVVNA